jgi:hypothetical protein
VYAIRNPLSGFAAERRVRHTAHRSSMSKFEFTATIVSIVIAFALSELMAGWGRILRHRPLPRIDWLFAAWSLGILLLGVLHWSGLWLYANTSFESLPQLFALLTPPLLLVPLAFLLSPDPKAEGFLGLDVYFREISRPTFSLLAAFCVASFVADVVVGGASPFSVDSASLLGFAGLLVAAAISGGGRLGMAALAILWISIVGFVSGLVEAPGW